MVQHERMHLSDVADDDQTLDRAIEKIIAKGDPFDPDYVATMWPDLPKPTGDDAESDPIRVTPS